MLGWRALCRRDQDDSRRPLNKDSTNSPYDDPVQTYKLARCPFRYVKHIRFTHTSSFRSLCFNVSCGRSKSRHRPTANNNSTSHLVDSFTSSCPNCTEIVMYSDRFRVEENSSSLCD